MALDLLSAFPNVDAADAASTTARAYQLHDAAGQALQQAQDQMHDLVQAQFRPWEQATEDALAEVAKQQQAAEQELERQQQRASQQAAADAARLQQTAQGAQQLAQQHIDDLTAQYEAQGNQAPDTTAKMREVAPLQDDPYGILRQEDQARAEGPAQLNPVQQGLDIAGRAVGGLAKGALEQTGRVLQSAASLPGEVADLGRTMAEHVDQPVYVPGALPVAGLPNVNRQATPQEYDVAGTPQAQQEATRFAGTVAQTAGDVANLVPGWQGANFEFSALRQALIEAGVPEGLWSDAAAMAAQMGIPGAVRAVSRLATEPGTLAAAGDAGRALLGSAEDVSIPGAGVVRRAGQFTPEQAAQRLRDNAANQRLFEEMQQLSPRDPAYDRLFYFQGSGEQGLQKYLAGAESPYHAAPEVPVPGAGTVGNQGAPPGAPVDVRSTFPNLGGELPPQPRLPETGQYPAVRTDDGGLYFDPRGGTHVQLIQDQGIPPDRVVGGGWLVDGDYRESAVSDSLNYGERARAALRVQQRRALSNEGADSAGANGAQVFTRPGAGFVTREGIGGLVGGLAGHAADVNDPNRPDPDTDPIGANRNLIGGAIAGGLVAGATRGLRIPGAGAIYDAAGQRIANAGEGRIRLTPEGMQRRQVLIDVNIMGGMSPENAASVADSMIASAAQKGTLPPELGSVRPSVLADIPPLETGTEGGMAGRRAAPAVPPLTATDEEAAALSRAPASAEGATGAPAPAPAARDTTTHPDAPSGQSLLNKAHAVYLSSLLSGPSSAAVVAGHGIASLFFRPADALFAGRLGDAGADVSAMLRGMLAGVPHVGTVSPAGSPWEALASGFTRGGERGLPFADVPLRGEGANAGTVALRLGGEALTVPMRVLSALHGFVQTTAASGQLAVDARRFAASTGRSVEDILANPPPGMLDRAAQASYEATTGVPRVTMLGGQAASPGTLMQRVDAQLSAWRQPGPNADALDIARAAMARFMLPLTHTALALSTRGVNMATTPVTATVRAGTALARGDLAEAAGRTVQAATATTAMLVGYGVMAGHVTGDHPLDASAPRNSVLLPGVGWLPTRKVAGAAEGPVNALANAMEEQARHPGAGAAGAATQVVNSFAKTLTDATGLRDIVSMFTAASQGRLLSAAPRILERKAESAIPYSGALRAAGVLPLGGQQGASSSAAVSQSGARGRVPAGRDPRLSGSSLYGNAGSTGRTGTAKKGALYGRGGGGAPPVSALIAKEYGWRSEGERAWWP